MNDQRRPAPEADRVVDLGDRGDAVVDEPERLAPERLEHAVGNEAVDLLAHHERRHPERVVQPARALDRLRRRALAAAQLDQREQVDGVERMGDQEPLGTLHPGRQCRRAQSRGRRGDQHLGPGGRGRLRQQRLLELEALGSALLHELDALGGGRGRRHERQAALARQRHRRESAERPAGELEGLGEPAPGLGIGVVEADVGAAEQEARGPAAADHTTAEQAHGARGAHTSSSAISCAARRAARPSDGSRARVTRRLGPHTLTIATGRWFASNTAAETPLE